jgi:hypothetical protein
VHMHELCLRFDFWTAIFVKYDILTEYLTLFWFAILINEYNSIQKSSKDAKFGNVYIWGSPFVMSRTDAERRHHLESLDNHFWIGCIYLIIAPALGALHDEGLYVKYLSKSKYQVWTNDDVISINIMEWMCLISWKPRHHGRVNKITQLINLYIRDLYIYTR